MQPEIVALTQATPELAGMGEVEAIAHNMKIIEHPNLTKRLGVRAAARFDSASAFAGAPDNIVGFGDPGGSAREALLFGGAASPNDASSDKGVSEGTPDMGLSQAEWQPPLSSPNSAAFASARFGWRDKA